MLRVHVCFAFARRPSPLRSPWQRPSNILLRLHFILEHMQRATIKRLLGLDCFGWSAVYRYSRSRLFDDCGRSVACAAGTGSAVGFVSASFATGAAGTAAGAVGATAYMQRVGLCTGRKGDYERKADIGVYGLILSLRFGNSFLWFMPCVWCKLPLQVSCFKGTIVTSTRDES